MSKFFKYIIRDKHSKRDFNLSSWASTGVDNIVDDKFVIISKETAIDLRDALLERYPCSSHQPEPAPAKWLEVSVDPKGAGHTYKLRVPGGWLYRTVTYRYPELHVMMEDDVILTALDEAERLDGRKFAAHCYHRACEIATQTTVFVPEAA